MKAYTCGITKKEFVKETIAHQKADNFFKGVYSAGEKGCAVGCALKSVAKLKRIKLSYDDHSQYETHLGIPKWLAYLEDMIFEGVSSNRSKSWPLEFAKSINEGADLDKVKNPFIIYLMKENLKLIRSLKYEEDKYPEIKKMIKKAEAIFLEAIKAQKLGNSKKILNARSKLSLARHKARSMSWSSSWSSAAKDAAWAASWALDSAELASRGASICIARSTHSAAMARTSAGSGLESQFYERFANKLLKLLKECR